MHNIIESFNPAEVHNRLGAGFKQLVRSGLRGPLRTSAEIHESFDHCVRPSWEKPFSGVRFDRRYVLNAIHGQGGILVSVEDVIEFVRFHGNHDLDAYTTRVPGEINVTIAGSNGRYCSLRRADAFTNRYYCFSNLADEYGGLDDEIEKAPKETTVGDPITLTLWASEFFHMHDPSQLCNISQILYCLEDATIKDLSLFFEPTIVQEIHGVNEWRGVYIDISSFLNICDYLQENSQIRLSDSARSRLNASLVPEHPFVTVDNERFIIIHTERLMPPAFLLERATCSADRYHIRGVGPKFAECGSGGKFSLRRNDVDHVIQECDSNGLYNAKEAIERIKSGSRSSQWTTIYRKPPPPVIVEDSGSSDEDDEPRFRWSRPRA